MNVVAATLRQQLRHLHDKYSEWKETHLFTLVTVGASGSTKSSSAAASSPLTSTAFKASARSSDMLLPPWKPSNRRSLYFTSLRFYYNSAFQIGSQKSKEGRAGIAFHVRYEMNAHRMRINEYTWERDPKDRWSRNAVLCIERILAQISA